MGGHAPCGPRTLLEPLQPPRKPPTGKPDLPHRTVLNDILWRLRTGAPWRDLLTRCGTWETASARFRRWQRARVWDRILAALPRQPDRQDLPGIPPRHLRHDPLPAGAGLDAGDSLGAEPVVRGVAPAAERRASEAGPASA